MSQLISVARANRDRVPGGMTWEQFCSWANIDPDTPHTLWVIRAWQGSVLFVHLDDVGAYDEDNKDEILRTYGCTKNTLFSLGSDFLGNELVKLVNQRGYSTVESCLSYLHDEDEQWRKEAKYILDLRRAVYRAAFAYLESLPFVDDQIQLESYDTALLFGTIPEITWEGCD